MPPAGTAVAATSTLPTTTASRSASNGAASTSHPTGRRPGTVVRRSELFDDAVAVLEADLTTDLQLTDVASRIATSPRQLQRVFAEVGGTTFRRHRASVRLERAATHLRAGNSVSETAALVGYRHPAHFSAAFRDRYGVAPSAYGARRDGNRVPR